MSPPATIPGPRPEPPMADARHRPADLIAYLESLKENGTSGKANTPVPP